MRLRVVSYEGSSFPKDERSHVKTFTPGPCPLTPSEPISVSPPTPRHRLIPPRRGGSSGVSHGREAFHSVPFKLLSEGPGDVTPKAPVNGLSDLDTGPKGTPLRGKR